jgi:drug/metabolite transporter (DMT)-like permease
MTPLADHEKRGLWFGLLGVAIFAMTLPMTRLAVGPADDPQLPPLFVTAGRAAFAGVLSVAWLLLTGAPRLRRADLPRWRCRRPARCSGFRSSSRWRCATWMRCTRR